MVVIHLVRHVIPAIQTLQKIEHILWTVVESLSNQNFYAVLFLHLKSREEYHEILYEL